MCIRDSHQGDQRPHGGAHGVELGPLRAQRARGAVVALGVVQGDNGGSHALLTFSAERWGSLDAMGGNGASPRYSTLSWVSSMKASSSEADWGQSSCRTTWCAPARSPMALASMPTTDNAPSSSGAAVA